MAKAYGQMALNDTARKMRLTLYVVVCQVDSVVLSSDVAESRSSELMDVLVDR